MDNFYSVIIGIFSSLIATAIFISSIELFRKVFLPWYANKIYRGVRIDGIWKITAYKGNSIEDNSTDMKFSFKQKGEIVSGTYQHLHLKTGAPCEYKFSGKIRDMYVLGTADPISNNMIDAISILLYVTYEDSILKLKGSLLCSAGPGKVNHHSEVVFEKEPS
jgi:hypothetical protein